MLHIRVDQSELNSQRKFACGIGPSLPEGDKWVYPMESMADRADCPGCNPQGPRQIGWDASTMDGNANAAKYNPDAWSRWLAFCVANGHP